MPAAGFLQYQKLIRLSQPVNDRKLYQAISKQGLFRFVEFGIGDLSRAKNMISVAQRKKEEIKYTGVDLFEAREGQTPLPLKDAHRILKSSGADVRLIPGTPMAALARCANELRGTDVVVISSTIDLASLNSAWHFLPRMLHQKSEIWIEPNFDSVPYRVMTAKEVREHMPRTKAAA